MPDYMIDRMDEFIKILPKSLKKFWREEDNFQRLVWTKKNKKVEFTIMDTLEMYLDRVSRKPNRFYTDNVSDLSSKEIIKEIKGFLNGLGN